MLLKQTSLNRPLFCIAISSCPSPAAHENHETVGLSEAHWLRWITPRRPKRWRSWALLRLEKFGKNQRWSTSVEKKKQPKTTTKKKGTGWISPPKSAVFFRFGDWFCCLPRCPTLSNGRDYCFTLRGCCTTIKKWNEKRQRKRTRNLAKKEINKPDIFRKWQTKRKERTNIKEKPKGLAKKMEQKFWQTFWLNQVSGSSKKCHLSLGQVTSHKHGRWTSQAPWVFSSADDWELQEMRQTMISLVRAFIRRFYDFLQRLLKNFLGHQKNIESSPTL